MSRFFFRLDGGDSLDNLSVIHIIFRIGSGVGVGVGVGTAPPRLRTPAFSIGLPYPTYVFLEFSIKIGDVIELFVVIPATENVLGILTLQQG